MMMMMMTVIMKYGTYTCTLCDITLLADALLAHHAISPPQD